MAVLLICSPLAKDYVCLRKKDFQLMCKIEEIERAENYRLDLEYIYQYGVD